MGPKRQRSADRAGPSKKAKTTKSGPKKQTIEQTKSSSKHSSKKPPRQKQDSKSVIQKVKGSSSDSWLKELVSDAAWRDALSHCFETDKFKAMESWLNGEYSKNEVFPPKELIFNAFNKTPFNQVKVIILGQDPYHDNGQAHGLSFSVPRGKALPPSLKNIYKELVTDYPGFTMPGHGCLDSWADQGVLLLNAALTVEAHKANSHARCGWWDFTDNVIKTISDQSDEAVFLLWGGFAHKKQSLIDASKHAVIKTAHPSPLSFNKFKGCKCFSQVNEGLVNFGKTPIDWNVA